MDLLATQRYTLGERVARYVLCSVAQVRLKFRSDGASML